MTVRIGFGTGMSFRKIKSRLLLYWQVDGYKHSAAKMHYFFVIHAS